MTRQKIANFLTYLCLFLLPWQTVWIYNSLTLGPSTGLGTFGWEYGKMTHYAVQLLIVIAVFVRWELKTNETAKKIMRSVWWFFGAMVLVSFLSVNPYLSGAFIFHILSAVLLFWLLLDERISTKKIIWFFVLGLIVPCLLGWWQVLVGSSPALTLFGLAEHLASTPGTSVVEMAGERLMRAYGTFAHPNIFGGYLVVAIIFIFVSKNKLLHSTTPRLRHSITLVILALFATTLVITFSRSAWLALFVGIILFFIVSAIYKIKIPRKFLFGLAVASVAFAASVAIFHTAVFTRVSATDRLETKSLTERESEYGMIGEVIKINPFVGVGPGVYTLALAEKFPDHDVWFYQPMHNSFLLFFAETGLLGLVFLIYFLWTMFVQCKRGGEWPFAPTVIVAAPAAIVFLDHYLWSQWAGLALVAVVLAIFVRGLEEK